ncbi:nitronate monooxygenase family protein [Xylophilus sp. GOD-11R]|uniref:NAD(P)H-dependent flavin oxidoreductase n=1 Tax=Xylophilus sp. GOD-11R TaxID=3089814 RepID=UPI00298BD371|nr:nitronate monooxygenase family protein [Xylophilus sp. GOD-11R]WPB56280.1 nitronate monooxygenase family protein [Xylophilus sp. GOD-11R]
MSTWPDTRILDLFGIALPILQAPMAGPCWHEMAIAVGQTGGLGALPCAMLSEAQIRAEVAQVRQASEAPLNLNFFCHTAPAPDAERDAAWRAALRPYYLEAGLDPDMPVPASVRHPFDATTCALVEALRPEVVSFHFGLPAPDLLARVKAMGAKVISSATTVDEAVWLEERGVDAVIAMGFEAGGHRGVFLRDEVYSQLGTFALVPQVVDAVRVPVIAAGGIADGRGVAAAFVLGASAVQVGTAFLHTPEARLPAVHRAALSGPMARQTALTNLFTGRPARGIVNRLMRELGPLSSAAPAFPSAGGALTPLKTATEGGEHAGDFVSLWAGQAAPLGRAMSASELTGALAEDALALLQR